MAVVHPLDNTFWIDAHRYKDAEVNYYTNLSKLQNNVSPSSLPNELTSNKSQSKKNKKNNDPNNVSVQVKVTISQLTDTQNNPSATANIENKETGNASGGKKKRNKKSKGGANAPENSLAAQVQKARQQLQNQLQNADKGTSLTDLVLKLEEDKFNKLEKTVSSLIDRISALELTVSKLQGVTSAATQNVPQKSTATPPLAKIQEKNNDDDDVDLFGSESEGEDEAAAKIREERLAAYAAKKSKKPALIAKSNIIFDVKPWDDETDMKQLEGIVRSIEQDGLLWGAAKLVPLAYGIKKLQISCVVEDDKVSVDEIQEKIETIGSECVQSVDIAAFNKI